MISGFGALSEKSIRATFVKMGFRALIATPLHAAMYGGFAFMVDEFSSFHWLKIGFAIITVVIFTRFLLWRLTNKLLSLKHGLKIWRALFAVNALALGVAWGVPAALNFYHLGISPYCFAMMAACFAVGTISVPAYAFDLSTNLVFQILLTLPMPIAMYLSPASTESVPFVMGTVLWLGFMLFISVSTYRWQIAVLEGAETIERQSVSLRAAHADLKSAHSTVRGMLESIEEAFLIFDLEANCQSTASSRAKDLLGMDPAGKKIAELLRITGKSVEGVESWYRMLVSGRLDFREQADRGPKIIENKDQGSILSLKFHPMHDEAGLLTSVIMTATDVTAAAKARKLAEEARERAELILRIHENTAAFRSFLKDFARILEGLTSWTTEDPADAKRDLHTLKGVTSLFGAATLSRHIFDTEIVLRDFQGTPEQWVKRLRVESGILRMRFESWKQREIGLFTQLGVFDEEQIEIPMTKLERIEKELESDPAAARVFARMREEVLSSNLGELLSVFRYQVENAGTKLGKTVELKLQSSESEPILMPLNAYRDIFRAMVHLFNNAVDHGIEPAEVRVAAGKPAAGQIVVNYARWSEKGKIWLRILIRDDGGGINIAKIRDILVGKGDQGASEASDLTIAQAVFSDGLSTKEEVSEISGQGVGMGAVKFTVLKARGKIRVSETSLKGTEFELLLPDISINRVASVSPILKAS